MKRWREKHEFQPTLDNFGIIKKLKVCSETLHTTIELKNENLPSTATNLSQILKWKSTSNSDILLTAEQVKKHLPCCSLYKDVLPDSLAIDLFKYVIKESQSWQQDTWHSMNFFYFQIIEYED